MEFRRSVGVIESAELLESSGMGSSLALFCNIRLFIIELDYGYRYLLEVCSELSGICFLSWLLLGILTMRINPQAHGYRRSFHS